MGGSDFSNAALHKGLPPSVVKVSIAYSIDKLLDVCYIEYKEVIEWRIMQGFMQGKV